MAGIDTIITQSFDGMFRSAILAVLKAIVPAMSVSTDLFSTGSLSAWEAVLFISESLISLAVVLVAYSLFTGLPIRGRVGSGRMISRLALAVILMPFTLYFAQLVLNVNDAMASFVIPYSQLATYSTQVSGKLGGYSVGALAIVGIVTLLLYLVLIVRTLLVFFLAALLPLLLLCEVFAPTRAFSRKMFSLFMEMAFLPFLMAIGFRIGIATSYSTFSSLQVPPLVIAGTYLLPLLVPFIISPTGGRILQYVGMPALSSVVTAASLASFGIASYAAGFISYPFRSAAGLGNMQSLPSNRPAFRAGPLATGSRNYRIGSSHSRLVMGRVFGGAARLASATGASNSIKPVRQGLQVSGRSSGGQKGGFHKIYMGAKKDE